MTVYCSRIPENILGMKRTIRTVIDKQIAGNQSDEKEISALIRIEQKEVLRLTACELVYLKENFSSIRFWEHFDLRLLDRYPLKVPIKGSYAEFNSEIIYITSNQHWSEWYPNIPNKDALWRRIQVKIDLTYMEKKEAWKGPMTNSRRIRHYSKLRLSWRYNKESEANSKDVNTSYNTFDQQRPIILCRKRYKRPRSSRPRPERHDKKFQEPKDWKNFTYTWYPDCREAISRTYNELLNSKLLNKPFANDTTIGYGLYSNYGQGIVKAPTQVYAKQVEFAKTFTTKFEITVKTYWSMWTLLKKPVKTGVTFENLSINDNEFYGPFGIMSPYPGLKAAEIRKVYVDADNMILKRKDVHNIEYRIGEFTINRK
ncbi:Replication-associated protein like [Argiope bruennichi]|uniref:Replication-associated protein like n=1 Tax=Argiope bruennichi TaxID=94029 RepID=A0A8T0E512_ARGBR|nr:Replication-associated protein like [Argiope bruennichi]